MSGPDIPFWQQRFDTGQLPWDRGAPSPQLQVWLGDGSLVPGRIAVPGCGSGHEVVPLARGGFSVTAIDYAPGAVRLTQARLAAAGLVAEVVQADVLAWEPDAPFDAIYEQTCLCALHPDHWVAYAARLHAWLRPGGTLALLAMQALREGAAQGLIEGPPYHVDMNALRAVLPADRWAWPRPPYRRVPHPANGWAELAIVLTRR
ncbi:methyltransferase domain-containing protein [Methylibium sp.]|uniref:methyltransferase domain-containing protein n=1 Tax=Methylibium sp. TaxID=2067992 RepID=UPI003BA9BC7F